MKLLLSCILLGVLIATFGSCSESPTPPISGLEAKFATAQQAAANLAKVLAIELNNNAEIRKELFSKMAYRFDGDRNILLRHFSDKASGTIEAVSKRLRADGIVDSEIDFSLLSASIPKPEIMMPFMEDWTDAEITTAGGLVVAYYPFGQDDRSIKKMDAFDKNGGAVKITPENFRKIPYVLIRTSERTSENGYLSLSPTYVDQKRGLVLERTLSLQGTNPKYFEITTEADWGTQNLMSLRPGIDLPELVPMLCWENCGGGGGGGGGGTSYVYRITELRFETGWEGGTEGEIELYWKYVKNGNWQKSPVLVRPYTPNTTMSGFVHTIISNSGTWLDTPIEMWDEDDISDDKMIDQTNFKSFTSGSGGQTFYGVNLSIPMHYNGNNYDVLGDYHVRVYGATEKYSTEYFKVTYATVSN